MFCFHINFEKVQSIVMEYQNDNCALYSYQGIIISTILNIEQEMLTSFVVYKHVNKNLIFRYYL